MSQAMLSVREWSREITNRAKSEFGAIQVTEELRGYLEFARMNNVRSVLEVGNGLGGSTWAHVQLVGVV